jgi:isoquinoline 1-oxidoreductase beta subunit
MNEKMHISRRDFFKVGAVVGGGFVLGFYFPIRENEVGMVAESATVFAPNAWIRINNDGQITVLLHKSEMGQGITTSLPMLVAEELEADWTKIGTEFAPAHKDYFTWFSPSFGAQFTGGSTSVRMSWETLMKAGAVAREMLIAAAAQNWGVDPKTCRAEKGEVIHQPSGQRATYGALVEKAVTVPAPKEVPLKDPKDYKLVGKKTARLDTALKVNGSGVFGIDVKVPGMLVAKVSRCPVFGGKVASFDATKAKAIKGVREIVQISSGIAVVADGYWPAKLGVDALEVKWDEGPNAKVSSASITEDFKRLAEQPTAAVARKEGDTSQALAGVAKKLEAVYEVPFLAHATMEPMNCTVHVRSDGCDIWAPTQAQTATQQVAMKIAGLPEEAIKVHTTLLGGGFGRRFEADFVVEAVEISKAVGAPVKLVWSREDDTQHDFYRPAAYNRLIGGLDAQGMPIVWTQRVVSPSIFARTFPNFIQNGVDSTSVEGSADMPYAIPNLLVDYVMKDTGVPVGFWRSVGHSQNAFITESFLDKLAVAAGKDPYELRRQLLNKAPRHKGVLELAATKAEWGQPLPEGRYRGIAVAESFGSFVAQVAEVSVAPNGNVRVHRVVCAVDCGKVVNPDTIEAQMQSAIVYGLTAALKGEISIENGRVKQSNFHDYEMLRIDEMPVVEVHIMPSTEAPGGVGEPGTPPIAPAVANAIFAATGKRIRKLPIRATDLKKA